MNDERGRSRHVGPSAEQLVGGAFTLHDEALKKIGGEMLEGMAPVKKYFARRIPGAPGLVLNGIELATAKDKGSAVGSLAGQLVGGALGGALGGPLGAAAGSVAGEMGSDYLYDHKDDIKAWMAARQAEIARQAATQLRSYLPPPLRNR